jgi:hypothetical protein
LLTIIALGWLASTITTIRIASWLAALAIITTLSRLAATVAAI